MRLQITNLTLKEAKDLILNNQYKMALFDLDQWLRSEIKHKDKEELQEARTKLYEVLEYYNLLSDFNEA